MIKSKSYNTTAGLNYIEAPELTLTTVYVVRRSGLQHDKYISGDANRTYIYQSSIGRISFPVAFNDGERVLVIYEQTSPVIEPIPGVCTNVIIPAISLPDGLVGVPYEQSLMISGSEPFDFSVTSSPSWMVVSISGNIVTMAGTPDAEGTETVQFDISNCDGAGNQTFSESINVIDNTTNFFVSNLAATPAKITKIIPKHWVVQTGSLPIHSLQSLTAAHGGFTESLSVFINGITFPYTLELYKNGSLLQTFPVTTDDQYTFDEQAFLSTDQIVIVLN